MNFNRQELQTIIEDGIAGKAVWASTGMQRMEEDGIKIFPSCYTLIGGNPGTGKTAFFHRAYVLNPYDIWIQQKRRGETDIELYWLIWSMERPFIETKLKWVADKILADSIRMNPKFPIVMDVQFLRGFKKTKVTNEIKELVYETFDYFEEMLTYMDIHSGQMNPTGISKDVEKYALTVGKKEKVEYTTRDNIIKTRTIYIPNNPKRITIIGIDLFGKLKGETVEGMYLKPESRELMQHMSDLCSQTFRDYYHFSPTAVNQFNRNIENANRFGNGDVIPQPSDFKNASNMYEDADVTIALFNPYKLGAKTFAGYDLQRLVNSRGANRSRFGVVLKNSYGLDDKGYAFAFIGETGYIIELKESDKITDGDYDYIISIGT